MKKTIAVVCIIVIVFAAGFTASNIYLAKTTEKICVMLTELEAMAEYSDALEKAQEIGKKWDKSKQILLATTNHRDIDNISLSILNIEVYLANGLKSKALCEIEIAKYLMTDLPEKEKLSVVNVF